MLRVLYLYYKAYPCLTDIILVLRSLFLSFKTYAGLTELILVFRSTYSYFRSYTCITGHILILRILYGAYSGTKVPVGTTQIHYTKVPVGTTGLISPEGHIFVLISDSYTYTGILVHVLVLITDIYLSNLFYRVSMCTEVPVGTISWNRSES